MNKIDEIVEREFPSTRFPVLNEYSKDQLRSLLQEVVEPFAKDAEKLMLFVGKIIERDDGGPYEWDGGDIQDLAERCGMFVSVSVEKSCGENCCCEDFPTNCYRLSELGKQCAAIAAAEVRAIGEDAITVLAKGK